MSFRQKLLASSLDRLRYNFICLCTHVREHEDVVEGQPLQLQRDDQTRLLFITDLLHIVGVVEGHVEVPERKVNIIVDEAVHLPSGLLPLERVVVGGIGEGVEDDVAGLAVEGELPEVHVALDVKVHPLGIVQTPIPTSLQAGGLDQKAGSPGVKILFYEISDHKAT